MLDYAAREVGFDLDSHLDQFVEVVGTDFKHTQYPGEGPAFMYEGIIIGVTHTQYFQPLHYSTCQCKSHTLYLTHYTSHRPSSIQLNEHLECMA